MNADDDGGATFKENGQRRIDRVVRHEGKLTHAGFERGALTEVRDSKIQSSSAGRLCL